MAATTASTAVATDKEIKAEQQTKVTLLSKDKVLIDVEAKVVRMLQTINNMMNELNLPENDPEPIPTHEVNARILKLIIEWATYHVDDPPKESAEEETAQGATVGSLSDWDQAFVDRLDDSTLFELIAASNYLNIEPLLDVTTKAVAKMIFKLSPEEIRKRFNIADDLDKEEKERIKAENAFFRHPDNTGGDQK